MRNHHFIIIILLFVTALSSCGVDKVIKNGEKSLALGDYYDAANQFKKAYTMTPTKERDKRGMIAAKMAQCYDKLNYTPMAIAAYGNVIRYKQSNADTHIALGRQLLRDGEYKQAAQEFQLALDSVPNNILAKNGLISAQSAPQWKQEGSRYTVKRMDVFNSRRADYSPVLGGDDHDILYFTSTRNEAIGDELSGITGTKNGDIFFSKKDDKGKWEKPQNVSGGVNTAYDEGACALSPDQREMYLTQCVSDPSSPRYAQIVVSNRSDAAWGKAKVVDISRDSLSSFAHPAISPDGQWLYFTSDMPGGMGGLDIWRVRITASGLGGVENLGAPINTPGNEEFPTFRPNGDFYFSSDGHPGMGGLDIFIAKVDKAGHYTLEHPGYPLNSSGDDFGMTFDGQHNSGFFSSNRDDGKGWDHIYSFDNPEIIQSIKGWVYEMGGYELPAAQVYLIGNDGTNKKLNVKSDGSFTYTVTPGVDYLVMATCKGYLNHTEQLNIGTVDESKEYTLQFPLPSISAPVLIDNIFYDFAKATLTASSTTALDELVKLLKENPNVTIELNAHCDYVGSAEFNKTLSQHRAESVVEYLIRHGIAKERLTPKGYGKERPKVVSKKTVEKYPWLKVGDVLTEAFIKKQTRDKQEICNQLNRRTEFKVFRTTYGMFDDKGKLKKQPTPKTPDTNKQKQDEPDIIFN